MAGQRPPLPVRGLHGPSSGQPSRRWRKPSSCRHRLPTLTPHGGGSYTTTSTTAQECFDQPQPITPHASACAEDGTSRTRKCPGCSTGGGPPQPGTVDARSSNRLTSSPSVTRRGPRPSRLAQRPGIGRDGGNTRTTARYQGRWPWPRHAVPQSGRAGRQWFLRSGETGPAEYRHVTPPCRATTRTPTASSTATRFLSSA